ncbi:LysR substrate-binding domain-containing protein [Comamonas avium]|uniref:LysR family transcriptional regulator n=1 Tax=Comamonas avium TaxID=2762231 RepID=A0ABR8SAC0_9BURK|nr:LysR substrate-binding domain-containing protein [Comamonas avium]MBD7960429.1 LysR family transcriptional regulator [Comamonas avium]
MEFRLLQYFVVLAEELHFSRAAQRLHISQPPLSVAIKQLEGQLSAQLFERSSKEVRLTAAGQHLLVQARDILDRSRRAALDTRAVAQGMAGCLRLGFVGSSMYRGLPEALAQLQAQHPQVRVDLHELNSAAQVTALQQGKIDLGLMHTLAAPAGLHTQMLLREPFMACLPAQHPLATQARLSVSSLAKERLVLFSGAVSPEYFRSIHSLCLRAGFDPELRHEVHHWLSVLSLVSNRQGVSIVPACLQRAGIPGLVFRPLRDNTVHSEMQAMWRSGLEHPLVTALLEHLKHQIEQSATRTQADAPAARIP